MSTSIQAHLSSLPHTISDATAPLQEASASRVGYPVTTRGSYIGISELLASVEDTGWEREYEAWLDEVEIQSRVLRGLL